jgi:hypothetical protein
MLNHAPGYIVINSCVHWFLKIWTKVVGIAALAVGLEPFRVGFVKSVADILLMQSERLKGENKLVSLQRLVICPSDIKRGPWRYDCKVTSCSALNIYGHLSSTSLKH